MKKLLFALFALSLLVPSLAVAHPGHEHKTMGTIASIEKAKLVVKSTENKDVTFDIAPTTTFKKGKGKGALADLKAGMRVVVATAGETESTAKEIQYAAAAATKQ